MMVDYETSFSRCLGSVLVQMFPWLAHFWQALHAPTGTLHDAIICFARLLEPYCATLGYQGLRRKLQTTKLLLRQVLGTCANLLRTLVYCEANPPTSSRCSCFSISLCLRRKSPKAMRLCPRQHWSSRFALETAKVTACLRH